MFILYASRLLIMCIKLYVIFYISSSIVLELMRVNYVNVD